MTAPVATRALTRTQAQRFLQAQALLQRRDGAGACRIARTLAAEAPDAADAQQLLAMCLADQGDAAGAHAAFARARVLAPHSDVVALNFASWLRGSGRLRDALQVLDSAPVTAQTRLQAGAIHLQLGDGVAARAAFAQAVDLQPGLAQAWHGLASALQAEGELDAADDALQRAIALAPGYAPAWVNRGAVLRMLGRLDAATGCLRRAQALGHDTPEVRNALLGLLQDRGEPAQALAAARDLVAAAPDFVAAQESLGHLLWEHGDALAPGEDPFAAFREAARTRRGHLPLQLAYARALLEAGRAADALDWLQALRAGCDEPALEWLVADVLDRLDRLDEAGALYARVARRLGDRHAGFLNAHARHAFRSGDPALARACAERAVRCDPRNQEAWSLLGTAWRLAGDPREDWLFGYEHLVGVVEIDTPSGYEDLATFLQALDARLAALHLASRAPRAQSVRGGTQTPGRLFGRDDPVIAAAEQALRGAVERWLAGLPHDATHPFLSRLRRSVRFVGSWSVRLRAAGHHASHVHDEGWLSSAFYVALPDSVRDAAEGSHAGWLQLGQPLESLRLDQPPRRLVQPRPGRLALFPSYLWHGTLPFADPQPRVTIAFDMQPAG
ncbi:putative 2OG-Fe(II) oxygenase [Luteimonas sp. YGD11-2]|uniref:putative 2OG-Fe(II) oxygenase n=1 Tax=Luteimonas sp. YGD11-2 TaxID=2508168 RepID=UPI00100BD535|nr:putative 2OG-Fe(II) oxygenase [Luteimonas sp. YGD11-2]